VLTQSDIERERYESRLKKQLDERSALSGATEKGVLIGRIQTFEELLKRSPTAIEQLMTMRLPKLREMVDDLQKQAFSGNGAKS